MGHTTWGTGRDDAIVGAGGAGTVLGNFDAYVFELLALMDWTADSAGPEMTGDFSPVPGDQGSRS